MSAVADMAAEVWDFHDRFGFDGGSKATRARHEVIIERAPILREEVEEMVVSGQFTRRFRDLPTKRRTCCSWR